MFVDKLFLAAGGVSIEAGISYPDFIDLHVKRAMIDAAKSVYLLADSKNSASVSSLRSALSRRSIT
ncbi:hypothetical protein ACMX25_14270 [Caballeronia sp. 15715]|uniref:hypothetical protein n=1 Tax=Caballeronia sp. 15715 TaxID=3391030 RepID=UPI0039E69254